MCVFHMPQGHSSGAAAAMRFAEADKVAGEPGGCPSLLLYTCGAGGHERHNNLHACGDPSLPATPWPRSAMQRASNRPPVNSY
jgi:hypothetical protein